MNSKVADLDTQALNLEEVKVKPVQDTVEPRTKNVILDRIGIWGSSLCALHCLLLPLLLPIAPLVASSIFAEVWFESNLLASCWLCSYVCRLS
jgi:hypothetical protein